MSERWSTDDVLALAPDSASGKAAAKVAKPALWPVSGSRAEPGRTDPVVFGECSGSGSAVYQVSVDLAAAGSPGHRCTCPSRKFPCKHVLGLLLLWARGQDSGPSDGPEWVAEWLARRQATAERAGRGAAKSAAPADPAAAARRAQRRERLVADGLAELELWLADQAAAGLAGLPRLGYAHWDTMAKRLVDCQAGRVAARVRELGGATAEPGWPHRVLAEFGLLRLLCEGHRRESLPPRLRAAVRARIGFAGTPEPAPAPREVWTVLGRHDFTAEELRGRRFWLRGRDSGRTAHLLSFAPQGGTPESPVRVGTEVDAELLFHTDDHRASVAARHAEHPAVPPAGGTVADALRSYAAALADDPWLEAWPVVLDRAALARDGGWWAADPSGDALPLLPDSVPPWRLAAVTGGAQSTLAAELTPDGLRPLTVWDSEGRAATL
ncbi:SWIM zinc finger family protein [Murinocardiopsis flavida]|uniref:SWIM zinc finger family protein n=1 Tax=Murinocardiopsis flavida TaxID=645275 RepID=UPI000D0DC56A|nr:SWIM zinc finger family protein [Murinocardiopsis flavida]